MTKLANHVLAGVIHSWADVQTRGFLEVNGKSGIVHPRLDLRNSDLAQKLMKMRKSEKTQIRAEIKI